MGNKTICFFNSAKAWGGGEKWHYEIAYRLHKEGHTIIVITSPGSALYQKVKETNIELRGINVSNLSFLNIFKIYLLRNLFIKKRVTSIIINLSGDLKISGLAAKWAGVEQIIYRRGSAIPVRNSFLNRLLFKKIITGIIANSTETRDTILANNQNLFDINKIEIIYNGIDLRQYDHVDYQKIIQPADEEIIIGNLGRMVKQKGQHYLIEIAEKLEKRNINFKMVIGGDGPLKGSLKQLTEQKNLENKIIFTGFVNHVKGFMESIDIFVLTSLWEGFGYVLIEAMACKKPVIAYNISSNPEILGQESGMLCEMGDTDCITEKIIQFVRNKESIEKTGSYGRNRVESFFNIDYTLKRVKEILQ